MFLIVSDRMEIWYRCQIVLQTPVIKSKLAHHTYISKLCVWFFQVPVDFYRLICWQGPCSKFGQISFGCPGFRGFSPLFRRRLPLFSRGRCMRRQATTWHGRKFSWGGKKAAFNLLMWVLPNLISSLFLDPTIWSLLLSNFNLMFQHDVVGVGRVYWFLAAVVFSCMPFSDVCFFPKWFLSVFRSDENSRHTSDCPDPAPALLYNGETHIK